jgi:chromate transporter
MPEADRYPEASPPALSHLALFLRFFQFGTLAFGGPVAQIAMIRRELVDEEKWIDSAHFNRLLAVMQVLPGPKRMSCASTSAFAPRAGSAACWPGSALCCRG